MGGNKFLMACKLPFFYFFSFSSGQDTIIHIYLAFSYSQDRDNVWIILVVFFLLNPRKFVAQK